MVGFFGQFLPKLPTRTGPKPPYQHQLGFRDYAYLVINSFIEFVFVNYLLRLLWYSSQVKRDLGSVGWLNTLPALWLLLVVDDMLYAPTHRFMHWKPVYAWVHKHHHRNTYPDRGYFDGANEHPLEQIIALSLHWIAIHLVAATSGVHAGTIIAHLGLKAAGACFNHTGHDLQFSFLGIDYSVRAHELHHRKPNTNFAQYVMFWDRLMGTYHPYYGNRRDSDPKVEKVANGVGPKVEKVANGVGLKAEKLANGDGEALKGASMANGNGAKANVCMADGIGVADESITSGHGGKADASIANFNGGALKGASIANGNGVAPTGESVANGNGVASTGESMVNSNVAMPTGESMADANGKLKAE